LIKLQEILHAEAALALDILQKDKHIITTFNKATESHRHHHQRQHDKSYRKAGIGYNTRAVTLRNFPQMQAKLESVDNVAWGE